MVDVIVLRGAHSRAMSHSTSVIVAGLGAMGSATLYHLARRGVSVRGFDRFAPPHSLGSTHGLSRIIREAYFEHPLYVPLVQRAYELWAELEARAGRALFHETGGLMIGPRDGVLVSGALRSAREHALRHELIDAASVRRRFAAFRVPDEMVALHEPRAGVLDPEQCVAAHLGLAQAAGAAVHPEEPVLTWRAERGRVVVVTPRGEYQAERLAICAGAWAPPLLNALSIDLQVERQVMHWFTPARDAELLAPTHCPIAMIEHAPERFFYVLPDSGAGVKAAIHHEGVVVDPDHVQRTVDAADVEPVRALLARFLPAAAGALRASATCLYTNTADQHFLIDTLPDHDDVVVASACSGHGFKFSSVVGEIVADLVTGRRPPFDLSLFRHERLLAPGRC